MRDLKQLKKPRHISECQPYIDEPFTIFEKIEFSNISKESMKAKIEDLRQRQVPMRSVLLDYSDEQVTFYWFKNWLHPQLKHFFSRSPSCKIGCSRQAIENDMELDKLHFFENGQQNYKYTMQDIEDYIKS